MTGFHPFKGSWVRKDLPCFDWGTQTILDKLFSHFVDPSSTLLMTSYYFQVTEHVLLIMLMG